MRIAYILPSLDAKAPIFLAKRLSDYFFECGNMVTVFYFDDICKTPFNCPVQQIKMSEPIDFDTFDIVHSHMYRPDRYVAKYSHLINHAKTVSTIHCNIKEDLSYSYGRLVSCAFSKIWLKSLSKFDAAVQINDYLMDLYKKPLPQSRLIYNGISLSPEKDDYSKIEEKIRCFHAEGRKVICSYSGIVERKGLLQILRLLKVRHDLAYVCIGEGAQKRELEDFAESNGIKDRVFFSPFKKNPYYVMESADIFAIPSYSEGFSLALLEAGSVGASVVCSDIPSFSRPFSTSEVSFFTLNDTASLSRAVDEAILQKECKKVALKEKIESTFSEQKMFGSYEEVYRGDFV